MFVVIFIYSADSNLRDYWTVVPRWGAVVILSVCLGIKRSLRRCLSSRHIIFHFNSRGVKTLSADLRGLTHQQWAHHSSDLKCAQGKSWRFDDLFIYFLWWCQPSQSLCSRPDCTLCYAWRFQSQLSYLLANSCTSWCMHIQASLCWYHVFIYLWITYTNQWVLRDRPHHGGFKQFAN